MTEIVNEAGEILGDPGWQLGFAVECLDDIGIRSALVHQLGYDEDFVKRGYVMSLRAWIPVPARAPSEKEPAGYPGREKEPLPPGLLDQILYALTRSRVVRQMIVTHLLRKGRLTGKSTRTSVMAELVGWKDRYEAQLAAEEQVAKERAALVTLPGQDPRLVTSKPDKPKEDAPMVTLQ